MMSQTVLVVDDEPINRRLMAQVLASTASVKSVSNGVEACIEAETSLPDLLLLDIEMPLMDGYAVCKHLRLNPRLAHTRIILVSAKSSAAERLKGYQVGADDYVVKPFVPGELLAKARLFLKLVAAERALRNVNNDLEGQVLARSEQLMRAERSAFLGAHTAEIVHNLNNPLAIVMGNVRMLQREIPGNVRLARASDGLTKIQEIIKTVLQANKQETTELQEVDLNEVLREELRLLEFGADFRQAIETKLELGPIASVQGHVQHFAQSFGNLIKNSVDAMHTTEKKELRLTTRQVKDHILVEISDSGGGISAENLARIFDPFFTTKSTDGKGDGPVGNGLGLPSVKRMLTACGATIEFESALGIGTTARIKVPMQPLPLTMYLSEADGAVAIVPPFWVAQRPVDEAARIDTLHRLRIVDTPPEPLFDDLALLAANACQMPVAYIGFVDHQRQWFKANHGLGDLKETPRDVSFCSHTILGKSPFIIEDASQDHRFANHPLVTGEQHVRFYAGVPLVLKGQSVGTLCVIDQMPRRLTNHQLDCLKAASRQIVAQLEQRLDNG